MSGINGLACLLFSGCRTFEEGYVDQGNIYSLDVETDKDVKGSFVLGTGDIKNEDKIKYYCYADGEVGKELKCIEASDQSKVFVLETDDEEPKLKKYQARYFYEGEFEKWFGKDEEIVEEEKYVIVVPENTIRREFNANI